MFFNEEGILDLDGMVMENESFRHIMADGEITEEEVKLQAAKVVSLLHGMEAKYNEEQLAEIKNLLVESNALYAAYNILSIQNIDK